MINMSKESVVVGGCIFKYGLYHVNHGLSGWDVPKQLFQSINHHRPLINSVCMIEAHCWCVVITEAGVWCLYIERCGLPMQWSNGACPHSCSLGVAMFVLGQVCAWFTIPIYGPLVLSDVKVDWFNKHWNLTAHGQKEEYQCVAINWKFGSKPLSVWPKFSFEICGFPVVAWWKSFCQHMPHLIGVQIPLSIVTPFLKFPTRILVFFVSFVSVLFNLIDVLIACHFIASLQSPIINYVCWLPPPPPPNSPHSFLFRWC